MYIIYIYIYMYIHIHIHIFIHLYIHAHIRTRKHAHTTSSFHYNQAFLVLFFYIQETFLVLFFYIQECQGLHSSEHIFQIILVNQLSSIQSSFEIPITHFTTGYDSFERNRDWPGQWGLPSHPPFPSLPHVLLTPDWFPIRSKPKRSIFIHPKIREYVYMDM